MQIKLMGGRQAIALMEVLGEQCDGEEILLTQQGEDIYIAFALASYTIKADGEIEDAG